MQLFVRTNAGKTVVVAADVDTLIRDVLARACEKEQQILALSYATAQSSDSSNNNNNSDEDVHAHPNEHDDNNNSDSSDAPLPTKQQLSTPASRYLHYGGVPLRPQRALHEYGIQNHATLELAPRLRGGCFSISIMLWIIIFICCVLSICTCGLSLPVAACLLPFALLLPLCCL